MGKNAVYWTPEFYHYKENNELKKLSLLFDKIYFKKPSVKLTASEIIGEDVKYRNAVIALNEELKLFEYLIERNVLAEYDSTPAHKTDVILENELQYLNNYLDDLKKRYTERLDRFDSDPEVIYKRFQTAVTVHDIQTRVDAVELSKKDDSEFYPILKSNEFPIEKGKRSQVVHFTLDNIPEPSNETTWEQIIEFRTDKGIRNKYLALIHWINKVSISSASLKDIQDEYKWLYDDYMRHFQMHEMKYNFSKVEVIVSAGLDFLVSLATKQYVSAFKNLLHIKLSDINLLQEEGKLPGKEIAYIYQATERFKKK